jgi:hypothetical protein
LPFVPAFVRSRFALRFASRRFLLHVGQSFLSDRWAPAISVPQSTQLSRTLVSARHPSRVS